MDFTLSAYKKYITTIKSSYKNIYRFDEFLLSENIPSSFCIIRHDVDRRPKKALDFAKLEYDLGITTSYYFRTKAHVFVPKIITQISSLGHEIGYHYECLSDMKGDINQATVDFKYNLDKLRKVTNVVSIAMHGSPLSRFDNRDLWRNIEQKKLLKDVFGIVGEVYLDIDYSDIAYITDTGRNWSTSIANKRDKVDSSINCDVKNGDELYRNFRNVKYPKVIFQVHPERWASNLPEFLFILLRDETINIMKKFF